jgi:hypothetical protein
MRPLIAILSILLLTGCYTRKKATTQFGRAAITYPELPAEYCARTYPTKDSVIKGKDIIHVDTLWGEGEVIIKSDTIKARDTIFIRVTRELPGKVIERTFTRTDTVFQTNTAAVDLCAIERRNAIALATDKTKEADKWRKIAKKRFWIILGMGTVMALGIFAIIKKKIAKKIPV